MLCLYTKKFPKFEIVYFRYSIGGNRFLEVDNSTFYTGKICTRPFSFVKSEFFVPKLKNVTNITAQVHYGEKPC